MEVRLSTCSTIMRSISLLLLQRVKDVISVGEEVTVRKNRRCYILSVMHE